MQRVISKRQKDKRLDESMAWGSRGAAAKFSQYFSHTQTAAPTNNLRNTSHFSTLCSHDKGYLREQWLPFYGSNGGLLSL